MKPRVVVVGSSNLDHRLQVAELPETGETVAAVSYRAEPGGKGLNAAVAARRFGARSALVSAVGNDEPGRMVAAFAQSEGLETQLGLPTHVPTGSAFVVINGQGDNHIVVSAGANAEVRAADLRLSQRDIVLAQLEVPLAAVLDALEQAAQVSAVSMLNPSPVAAVLRGEAFDAAMALADFVIVNRVELAALVAGTSADVRLPRDHLVLAARQLIRRDGQQVIVTAGSEGALLVTEDAVDSVHSLAVTAVDTAGAGDCFSGAFAAALCEGTRPALALAIANVAAGLQVQQQGCALAMPRRQDIERILATHGPGVQG